MDTDRKEARSKNKWCRLMSQNTLCIVSNILAMITTYMHIVRFLDKSLKCRLNRMIRVRVNRLQMKNSPDSRKESKDCTTHSKPHILNSLQLSSHYTSKRVLRSSGMREE